MNALDWGMLAVLMLSALYGLRRGLVAEVLILASWLGSFLLARAIAGEVGRWLPVSVSGDEVRWLLGFAVAMLAAWLGFFVLRQLLDSVLRMTGLTAVDRFLGMGFGLARGGLLLTLATLLAGLTELPKQPLWQGSAVARPLEQLALTARGWLPAEMAAQVHFPHAGQVTPSAGAAAPWIGDVVQPAMPASPPTLANPEGGR